MSIKAKHNKLIKELIQDDNYIILENGQIFNKKGKELGYVSKSEIDLRSKQYRYIKYQNKHIKIHRIIYAKFKGELKQGQIVHHRDGNGLNNDINNLDQVSQQENMYYKLYPEAQCDNVEPSFSPPMPTKEVSDDKMGISTVSTSES